MTPSATGQFRFGYFTRRYDETVTFYREGLGLPVLESWDRGDADRGILFRAGAGVIEVQFLPDGQAPSHLWDDRPPQGAFMAIEMGDVDEAYQLALKKGLPILESLTTQPWGHRSFCLREPNGLTLYMFSPR